MINMGHELVILSDKVDWDFLYESFVDVYCSDNGRPGVNIRLMTGLLILKSIHKLSDEDVVERWVENPYYQYFCGEVYFKHKFPISPTSLTHFRQRVGEDRLNKILDETLMVAFKVKAIKVDDLKKVIVDTTVQEKNVIFPSYPRLLYKAICELSKMSKKYNIKLRQTYLRVGKSALVKYFRYRHAKQFRRARKQEKFLKLRLARIIRDIKRNKPEELVNNPEIKEHLSKATEIFISDKIKSSKGKLLSWDKPEVECIGKGKIDKPYEFGCKASITTTLNPSKAGHLVLHSKALHNNPYDGHTLKEVIKELENRTGITTKRIFVDKGYVGHNLENKIKVYRSGQKRGVNKQIKQEIKRRSAVEPIIGHLKNDHHLDRNYLKGQEGDKINAVMAAIGYNFARLLKYIKENSNKILLALLKFRILLTKIRKIIEILIPENQKLKINFG